MKTGVAAAALSLLAAGVSAQSVTYDFDRGADFARLRTYAWAPGTHLKDELNHKRIVAAIEGELAAKGMARVEPGARPDALVAYHVGFDQDLSVRAYGTGWAGPGFGPARMGSARVEEVLIGTITVEIREAQGRSLVWRGVATRDVDTKAKPEKRERNIERTAEKLFKSYPPK